MDRELAILRLTGILEIDWKTADNILTRVERQSPRAAWWHSEYRSRRTLTSVEPSPIINPEQADWPSNRTIE